MDLESEIQNGALESAHANSLSDRHCKFRLIQLLNDLSCPIFLTMFHSQDSLRDARFGCGTPANGSTVLVKTYLTFLAFLA